MGGGALLLTNRPGARVRAGQVVIASEPRCAEQSRGKLTDRGPVGPAHDLIASVWSSATERPTSDRDESSRLALAYRAGDRGALSALHRLLWPLMARAIGRYRDWPGSLPNTLERADLVQESWLILANLAAIWRPAGGDFGAYVRVSFPWVLERYIRQNSPNRRTKRLVMLGTEQPGVQEQVDLQPDPGADGREWDNDLAWSELLEPLSERERAALLLHLADQRTFTDVAQALQLTRPAAYRLYRRALKRVQGSPIPGWRAPSAARRGESESSARRQSSDAGAAAPRERDRRRPPTGSAPVGGAHRTARAPSGPADRPAGRGRLRARTRAIRRPAG